MGALSGGGSARNLYMSTLAAQQGATQQAAANKEAAIAGAQLSMINQYTPYGNLEYAYRQTGVDGTPLYNATTTYDADTQRAINAQKRVDYKTNELAESQTDRANAMLGTNADFGESAINAKVQGMINPRLSQRFNQEEDRLRGSLINRGLREGSAGYEDAFRSFNEGKNDAYAQEALSNRQQALQEIALPRNQTLNEIASLLGAQQIGQPNFVNTPRSTVQPADYQRAADQSISALNQYQRDKQATAGGFAGMIGQGIGLGARLLSDERAKEGMTKIGKTDDGQKIYSYRYAGGGPLQIGLSAQEVEKVKPEAVSEGPHGFKMVNYALALARKNEKGKRHAA